MLIIMRETMEVSIIIGESLSKKLLLTTNLRLT